MNVYVESNFVLELALLQEQQADCERLLRLCEDDRIQIIVPAYSLAEPYETLRRRHVQRREMKHSLDEELKQLARTVSYTHRLTGFQQLTALLIDSADEEARSLESIRSRLVNAALILPLDLSVLSASILYQRRHGLSPQDALVYTTIHQHLEQSPAELSCFLNRNSKDFDDPDIVAELRRYNCKLLPRFDSGYNYVVSCIS